ncbi:LmbU family transcriptional regulator [Streptomyces sp. NPDC020965]|uniref:LmbU family transcriptional regulator n=1 Tax=Streptomyces sp. NPDC020965 TaxID=3365105 RepID=UPI0037B61FC6
MGRHIFVINDSSGWWLGDWLIYGQSHYPDRYKAAVADTGLSYQTLRNYAWTAGRFPVARRHGRLSLQHHAEVASLAVPEQDRWLRLAESSGWSRNELRGHLRESQRRALVPPPPPRPAGVTSTPRGPDGAIRFQVSTERRTHWEKAAANQGQHLAEWIVSVLDNCLPAPTPSPLVHGGNARA